MIPALFVHHSGHLDAGGGGVQLCSREYFAALTRAGFSLTPVEIPPDRRIEARVRRRFWPDPYTTWINRDAAIRKIGQAGASRPRWVFFNQHSLGELAGRSRAVLPAATKYAMLSHGLESTDYLHEMRELGGPPGRNATKGRALMLGWRLVQEARHARQFDHLFCLSDFEREIEHWLGSASATVIPRTVTPAPLDWRPLGSRLGFVGTLNHAPNREGLLLFLDAYKAIGGRAEVRVVGGPADDGRILAARYPCVTYLGALPESALVEEASTWNCFLHPIFCYARGASTKLATALAWQIPVATTTTGFRGYSWRDGTIPCADDPRSFALLAETMLDRAVASRASEQVRRVTATLPTIDEVAAIIRERLESGQGDAA